MKRGDSLESCRGQRNYFSTRSEEGEGEGEGKTRRGANPTGPTNETETGRMTQQGGQRSHWPTAVVQVSGTFYGRSIALSMGCCSLPCSSPDSSLSHRETRANPCFANVFEFCKAGRLIMVDHRGITTSTAAEIAPSPSTSVRQLHIPLV